MFSLKKIHAALTLPDLRGDIYAAVEEILRYRRAESDERKRKHQKTMANINADLMRDPECNYNVFFSNSLFEKSDIFCWIFIIIGFSIRFSFCVIHFSVQATVRRQATLAQLEKELEEIELEMAAEQSEIDKIAEEEQQVIESYEANIREMQAEIDNEEAEIAQIVSKTMNKEIFCFLDKRIEEKLRYIFNGKHFRRQKMLVIMKQLAMQLQSKRLKSQTHRQAPINQQR